MPNIDDFKFKKKTFRPWDKDILSQLKIEEPFKKEEEKHDTNLIQTEAKLEPKFRASDDDILEQLTHKKPTSNLQQSGSKLEANLHQTPFKPTPNLLQI